MCEWSWDFQKLSFWISMKSEFQVTTRGAKKFSVHKNTLRKIIKLKDCVNGSENSKKCRLVKLKKEK